MDICIRSYGHLYGYCKILVFITYICNTSGCQASSIFCFQKHQHLLFVRFKDGITDLKHMVHNTKTCYIWEMQIIPTVTLFTSYLCKDNVFYTPWYSTTGNILFFYLICDICAPSRLCNISVFAMDSNIKFYRIFNRSVGFSTSKGFVEKNIVLYISLVK